MSVLEINQPLPVPVEEIPPRFWRPIFNRGAFWAGFALVVIGALIAGLLLRRWAWDQTEPIRYQVDINNAFRQGTAVLALGDYKNHPTWKNLIDGYINRYDERTSEPERQGQLDLDYAPGRLAVATLWARWVHQQPVWENANIRGMPTQQQDYFFYPRARSVKAEYELCKPMLMVNLTGEILSTIAMFFLVRRYTSGKPPNHRPMRGNILGLVSALFFWFNPALIWNAHCWPQWDSWVLPFFLWALLLASLDWWFCAGLLIAAGAMFKGQILFGAPLFLMWPLFQGRLPAMVRWLVGLLSSAAAITAVWAVRIAGVRVQGKFFPGSVNPHAIEWIVYMTLIFAGMTSIIWAPRKSRFRLPLGVVIAAVITWILGAHTSHSFSLVGFAFLAAAGWWVDDQCSKWSWEARLPLALAAVLILIYPIYVLVGMNVGGYVLVAVGSMGLLLAIAPLRAVPFAAAGWIASAILLCTPLFDTSRGWFDLGIAYGTHHFENMSRGDPNNLPELLESQWQWDDLMAPALTIPKGDFSEALSDFLKTVDPGLKNTQLVNPDGSVNLPLKYLLVGVWIVSLILSSIGLAMHDRNRSPRFLLAISAPWIMFFAVMVQMHQRYLLWGSSLGAAGSSLNPGFAILHVFLSIVAMGQEMHSMLNESPYRFNAVNQFLGNWHPGVAWAVLLCAGIYLYSSLKWEKSEPTPKIIARD